MCCLLIVVAYTVLEGEHAPMPPEFPLPRKALRSRRCFAVTGTVGEHLAAVRGKDIEVRAGFRTVTHAATHTPVTVYWRRGCPYRRRLRADLHRTGLPVQEIDIWRDPEAAATVRSLAGGNETVPTVTVGEQAMVNPRIAQVLDAVRQVAPELVTNQASRSAAVSRALRVAQWSIIAALIVASFTVEALGHSTMSWVFDGVAVAVYLVFRLLRR